MKLAEAIAEPQVKMARKMAVALTSHFPDWRGFRDVTDDASYIAPLAKRHGWRAFVMYNNAVDRKDVNGPALRREYAKVIVAPSELGHGIKPNVKITINLSKSDAAWPRKWEERRDRYIKLSKALRDVGLEVVNVNDDFTLIHLEGTFDV